MSQSSKLFAAVCLLLCLNRPVDMSEEIHSKPMTKPAIRRVSSYLHCAGNIAIEFSSGPVLSLLGWFICRVEGSGSTLIVRCCQTPDYSAIIWSLEHENFQNVDGRIELWRTKKEETELATVFELMVYMSSRYV